MYSLGNKIWFTSRTRIQTERRLRSGGWHSQFILLWYSFFGVAVAVYSSSTSSETQLDSVTWVIYSILILVLSGFLQGSRFGERAAAIKQCYENLQKLLTTLEQNDIDERTAREKYFEILDSCENHIGADFVEAVCVEWLSSTDKSLTRTPTNYMWFSFACTRVQRLIWYSLLYSLPAALLLAINFWGRHLASLG